MPVNSGSPIIGRLASAGFGFLSSTAGFPVAGSIGSFSQTITPQIPPPHLLTLTLASPAWVSQIPVGSPSACAKAGGRGNQRQQDESQKSKSASHEAPQKSRLEYQQIGFAQRRDRRFSGMITAF